MAFSLTQRIAQAQGNTRQDGMSQNAANAICEFQAWAERLGNCDYAKLRTVLADARGENFSLEQLQRMYFA